VLDVAMNGVAYLFFVGGVDAVKRDNGHDDRNQPHAYDVTSQLD
jgi:hypothetical protein